jgi:voltage-gated potassium channel Kch
VFFASIGLRLAADDLLAYWVEALVASAVLMVGNFWIMFYLIDREEFSVETSFLGSINMIQVSEFSLVVGALAVAQGFVGTDILGYLSLMALLTMSLSVYIINYNHAIYERVQPWFSRFESEGKGDVDLPEYRDHAVAIGYDEVTRSALPFLEREFGHVVVIDRKTAHVEALEEAGYDAIYGDFRHGEIRKAASLKQAAFVLSSTVQPEVNKALLAEVPEDATVFVEADWIEDARELYDLGAHYVIMSTHLTAERISEYLELYFEDPESFREYISDDLDRIRRREGPTLEIEVEMPEQLGEHDRDTGTGTDAGSGGGGGE